MPLPAHAEGLHRGPWSGDAQHPHHIRRDGRASEDEFAIDRRARSPGDDPGAAPAAARTVGRHPGRHRPEGRHPCRGRPQSRGASGGRGAQLYSSAARHSLDRRVHPEAAHCHEEGRLNPLPTAPSAVLHGSGRSVKVSKMQLVLISGLSGSGKSVALNALEDSGYYCVDNLPGQLLQQSAELLRRAGHNRVAMSIDARTGDSLEHVPEYVSALKGQGVDLRLLFLDAKNDTLIRRFSETRRRHPLATGTRTLEECLTRERELLAPVGEIGHRVDTTDLQPNTLRNWIKDVLGTRSASVMLLFECFS